MVEYQHGGDDSMVGMSAWWSVSMVGVSAWLGCQRDGVSAWLECLHRGGVSMVGV